MSLRSKINTQLCTSYDIEIPFYDVDAYRIVWHGNYAKYFEVGRCQLLEDIGYPYEKMEQSGYFFPVIDMQVKYVQPIKFKQRVRVLSCLKLWENKLTIDYQITDLDSGEVLTKAQTSQVAIKMPDNVTQFQSPDAFIKTVDAWVARRRG